MTCISREQTIAFISATFFALAVHFSCLPAAARDTVSFHRDGQGVGRKCILHLPNESAKQPPLPLVVVLHGGGQNAQLGRYITRMNETADKHGFAVLYPDGRGRYKKVLLTWNGGDCCGYSTGRHVNDSAFIADLIDAQLATGRFDPRRVYVAGFSNGAMLAHKFACEHASKVAAIACIGGSMTGREREPGEPVSVLMIHGTADKHVPYHGGVGKLAKWGYPVNRQSVVYAKAFWVGANGCTDRTCTTDKRVRNERFSRGKGGSEVQLLTIDRGLHSWPGGRRVAHYGDKPFAGMNASEECWSFFSRHSKTSGSPQLAEIADEANTLLVEHKDSQEQRETRAWE